MTMDEMERLKALVAVAKAAKELLNSLNSITTNHDNPNGSVSFTVGYITYALDEVEALRNALVDAATKGEGE